MASDSNQPRVLLATGIFFPDVGGPATHVRHIAEHLHSLGWQVTVIAFGKHRGDEPYRVRRVHREYGKLFSWCEYGWHILSEARRHDIVYAFDLTTAGIPAAIAARVFGKPFLLRIGGDPIWERIVEKGKRFMPMRAYYEAKLYQKDRPVLYEIIRRVVGSADRIVTYCDFIRDIYVDSYGVSVARIVTIRNPFLGQDITASAEQDTFTYLFAGRFVAYKNLPRVIRAFARVAERHANARLMLIGHGPDATALRKLVAPLGNRVSMLNAVDQKTLFMHIDRASVALAPALTEFNPNFVLEALSRGKPALISRDNGLSVELPEELQFDPMDDASVEEALERIIDPKVYGQASAIVSSLPHGETWASLVKKHAELIRAEVRSQER